jgi:hypothetical protein
MTAHTNVQSVSLYPWVAATGNIFVTQALYRNILFYESRSKTHAAKNYITCL